MSIHLYWYTLLKKCKEHFDIMIFIERYPLKRCQGCVKLIASKVNCFLNINDFSEVQLCMSSNSWTWECPHTKDGADHVPLIFLSSVWIGLHLQTYYQCCAITPFSLAKLHIVDKYRCLSWFEDSIKPYTRMKHKLPMLYFPFTLC